MALSRWWAAAPGSPFSTPLGGRANVKFIALLVQGIPRSLRITEDLPRADTELAPLELAAVKVDDAVLRIPDLEGLEQLLADAELI